MCRYAKTRFKDEGNFDAYARRHEFSCERYYSVTELRRKFRYLTDNEVNINKLPGDLKAVRIMNMTVEEAKSYEAKPRKKKLNLTLTYAQANQLGVLLDMCKEEGWYYGNKDQFYKRTDQMIELLDEEWNKK